jgi:hypothetical protein
VELGRPSKLKIDGGSVPQANSLAIGRVTDPRYGDHRGVELIWDVSRSHRTKMLFAKIARRMACPQHCTQTLLTSSVDVTAAFVVQDRTLLNGGGKMFQHYAYSRRVRSRL